MMGFLLRILTVFSVLSLPAWPLDPSRVLTQFGHDVWQIKEGLPQNTVATLIQTRDGYLWMGTHEGLVRFDGVQFKVFDKQNTDEILSNDVYSLLEDPDGTLWFGTYGGGLHNYKDGRIANFKGRHSELGDVITSLARDAEGGLWIGMTTGLLHYWNGSFVSFTQKLGIAQDQVRSLLVDRQGVLWVATATGGVVRYQNGTATRFDTGNGLLSNSVWAVLEDYEGSIWIGTEEGPGLSRFRNGKFDHISVGNDSSATHVWSLYEDRDHTLWIGTRNEGLKRLVEGRLSTLSSSDGLSDSSVRVILQDKEGSLWIGTDAGGLNRLKDGKFLTYTTKEGLSDNSTWSVFEAKDGSMWIGTRNGGVNQFRNGEFRVYTTADGLADNTVRSVIEDRQGTIWVGTRGGGVTRLRDGKLTTISTKDGLSNNIVWSLMEDRDGSIWIGTDHGLNRYQNGQFTGFTTEDGLSDSVIMCTLQDRHGNIWIGTDSGGLNVMKDGRILRKYTIREGLAGNSVISVYEDDRGVLWIGTWGGGLSRMEGEKITNYSMKNGLFDDVVFQTLEDHLGYLWMSSNKGIFKVLKQELEDLADGKISRIQSRSYGTDDGMKSSECNGSNYPAGWKRRDGTLWFPTVEGVTVIDPGNLMENRIPPAVIVEQMVTNLGTRMPTDSGISFDPGVQKFEIHYTALSFLAPEKVLFRFQLEGFDQDWIEAGTRRIAYYTNVPPGSYRFRVTACNNDGHWNETGASFAFRVQPRFYNTSWFYGFIALAASIAVAAGHRLRTRQLRLRHQELVRLVDARTSDLKAEKERTESALRAAEEAFRLAEEASHTKSQFLANMSHELRTPLNAIIGYSEMLHEEAGASNVELLPDIQKIRAAGKHLLFLINDILDLSKIEAGKMELRLEHFDLRVLLREVVTTIEPMLEKNRNRLNQRSIGAIGRIYADPVRLRQILLNILSNATKFTEGGIINFDAERSSELILFRIQDTGIGIKTEQLSRLFQPFEQADASTSRRFGGTGLGLVISKRFCQMMGGDIHVESEYGKGSTFTVWFPADAPSHSPDLAHSASRST